MTSTLFRSGDALGPLQDWVQHAERRLAAGKGPDVVDVHVQHLLTTPDLPTPPKPAAGGDRHAWTPEFLQEAASVFNLAEATAGAPLTGRQALIRRYGYTESGVKHLLRKLRKTTAADGQPLIPIRPGAKPRTRKAAPERSSKKGKR